MRGKFRGWYKPTAEELELLWNEGLIVLDANVMLAAYRMASDVRGRLFDTIEAFGGRVTVPFQAALEYQENRLTVIAAQRATYDEIRAKVAAAEANLLGRRPDHPVLDPTKFRDLVQRSLAAINRYVDQVEQEHPNLLGEDPLDDSVRERWDALLTDSVGEALSITPEWKKEADERYARKVPPGFEDEKKPEGKRGYGDLIVWCELLEKVKAQSRDGAEPTPVIFVTDDAKQDWWQIYKGRQLGPRPELVEEMQNHGGAPFWMYSVSRFLEFSAEHFHWAPLRFETLESSESEFVEVDGPDGGVDTQNHA